MSPGAKLISSTNIKKNIYKVRYYLLSAGCWCNTEIEASNLVDAKRVVKAELSGCIVGRIEQSFEGQRKRYY